MVPMLRTLEEYFGLRPEYEHLLQPRRDSDRRWTDRPLGRNREPFYGILNSLAGVPAHTCSSSPSDVGFYMHETASQKRKRELSRGLSSSKIGKYRLEMKLLCSP